MKLLWCHSHLVWLVFEGSIPTCTCFHSEIHILVVIDLYSTLIIMAEGSGSVWPIAL